MGALNDWAKSKSNFLKLDENESVTVVYKGFKIVPSRFEQDQETVQYTMEVEGEDKFLESKANNLARELDKIEIGTSIVLTKTGSGNKTRYSIAKLGEEKEKETEKEKSKSPA